MFAIDERVRPGQFWEGDMIGIFVIAQAVEPVMGATVHILVIGKHTGNIRHATWWPVDIVNDYTLTIEGPHT